MIKIRKIRFLNHPVLKNLELNFCDTNGKAVDTVILAGENGTGKSTILDALYQLVSYRLHFEIDVEIEKEHKVSLLRYRLNNSQNMTVEIEGRPLQFQSLSRYQQLYSFNGIFSDVDINFHSKPVSSVTSLSLDSVVKPQRSSDDLPKTINQLLIDIQTLDDSDLANNYRVAKQLKKSTDDLQVDERMSRFKKAFAQMFDDLTFSRIDNRENKKVILFRKKDAEVPIEQLSSGEKQIVYRGCFLLKDVNALKGGLVFIDEPEISLHPLWQEKILNYYKSIFTDEKDVQTSQIFVVTHSPFIVHNKNRINDKVIVLNRDSNGDVHVMDKPVYFKCDSKEVVEDAFSIQIDNTQQPTVYVEGRTDEKYFVRAAEVFQIDLPFKFKWIGYLDDKGNEVNSGAKNLDKAFHILVSMNLGVKNFCLKDCDTNSELKQRNNVTILSMKQYKSKIKKGIENALVLDEIDMSEFYEEKKIPNDYGSYNVVSELEKMELCDYLCSLDDKRLEDVFFHLKEVIEVLKNLYEEDDVA